MTDKLDVYLWDRKVGSLVSVKDGYRTKILFYYDAAYVADGWDIAPLRAPVGGRAARMGLPFYPETEKEFGGLPSFIADSLPDHWGNRVLSEWARENGIRRRDLSPLDMLAFIGHRGMGALEFVPVMDERMESPFKVKIEDLHRLARKVADEAGEFKLEAGTVMVENLFKVGTSAGGRRPKAVINFNHDTGECYSGQVATDVPWFTPMIIKFDEHTDAPTTRIEYGYYLMALDAGLRMMPSGLVVESGAAHFLTERFDRNWNGKIHVQTLAAMNPGARSYEGLFEVACRLKIPAKEMRQLFLAMTLNVLTGNVDDHNKNFSFLMDRDGQWHATPAYDFTFAVDLSSPEYVNRHSMTVNGRDADIGRDDLLEVAGMYSIRGAATMIAKAADIAAGFQKYAAEAGLSDKWADRIRREIDRRTETVLNPMS